MSAIRPIAIDEITVALRDAIGNDVRELAVVIFGSALAVANPWDIDVWVDGRPDAVADVRSSLERLAMPLHVSTNVEAAGFSHELLNACRWEVAQHGVAVLGSVTAPDGFSQERSDEAWRAYYLALARTSVREAAILSRIAHPAAESFTVEATRRWLMAFSATHGLRSHYHRADVRQLATLLVQEDSVAGRCMTQHGWNSPVLADLIRDRVE